MNLNEYRIAIPSYKRSEIIIDKTITILNNNKIDPERVTIFVANEEEYEKYKYSLKNASYRNIVIGEVGMGAIRRFIQKYYPENSLVMNLDDDLGEILKKESDKKMIPITDLEQEVIFRGFQSCHETGAKLFGIHAAANALFMKHRVAKGLYYCIGSCWGVVNRHDEDLSVTLDDKEDFERTLQHYVKDGIIVRLDDITVKSAYYITPGGMQIERTSERILTSANELQKRYPHLCSVYIRNTTGHAELRLRNSMTTPVTNTLESFL